MRFLKSILLLPFLLLCAPSLMAGVEEISDVKKGDAIKLASLHVSDPFFGQSSSGFQVTRRQVAIKLFHNDVAKIYEANGWTLSVDYTATLKYPDGTSRTETGTLNIAGDPDDGLVRKNMDVDLFAGVSYATIQVGTITFQDASVSPSPITTIYDDIHLEVSLITERYYDLNVFNSPTIHTANLNSSNNTLELAWSFLEGAEEYELEYLFIADGSLAPANHQSSSKPYDFKNATRINVTSNSYPVSMAFPRGSIIFRVRGVGYDLTKQDFKKYRVYSDWSYIPLSKSIAQAISDDNIRKCYYYFDGLDLDKNWTYTATYAEDGKRKEVASYFDGSGRTRQMVTINNSDSTAIVGESKYDFVGRGAVNILPAPVANEGVKFYGNSANPFNGNWGPYNFATDNHLSEGNDTLPEPLPSTSKASKYYSSTNDLEFINKDAVPDAGGYPYSMTHYTNDGTERPLLQSGVGDTLRYKAQESRNTKYFYGSPTQSELDRLFGTEAGHSSFYRKNIIIDPNRQQSIQYLDNKDRIVATALSGANPSNLDIIPDNNTDSVSSPLFNGPRVPGTDEVIIESMEYMSTSFDPVTISYGLTKSFLPSCRQPIIGASGFIGYDVYMEVKNSRGETVANGSLLNINSRNESTFLTFTPSIGNYTITRTIKINEASKEDYLLNESSLVENNRLDSSCSPFYFISSDTVCEPLDCDSACKLSYSYVLDSVTYYTDTAGNTYGPAPSDSTKYQLVNDQGGELWTETNVNAPFNIAIALCVENCEGYLDSAGGYDMLNFYAEERCNMKSQMLQFDLSPGGQYMDFDCDTIFCIDLGDGSGIFDSVVFDFEDTLIQNVYFDSVVISNGVACFSVNIVDAKTVIVYDPSAPVGLVADNPSLTPTYYCDTTYDSFFTEEDLTAMNSLLGTSFENIADLLANWDPQFAQLLIPMHPEYCAYDYFCNYSEECSGGILTMQDINVFAGEMYYPSSYSEAINYTAHNSVNYNIMNPLGFPPQVSSGILNDNSNYMQSGTDRSLDPLVDCGSTDPNTLSGYASIYLAEALQNFIPIYTSSGDPVTRGGNQAYYSYWYLLDDPDNIADAHGGNNSGLDNTIIDLFNTFHGDGGCTAPIITDDDSKFLFFKSTYMFFREKAIYNYFDDVHTCSDNQLYTFWDADTTYDGTLDDGSNYVLNYPKNRLYDLPDGPIDPDSIVVIQNIVAGNSQTMAIGRMDSLSCDRLLAYMDYYSFDTSSISIPYVESGSVASQLNSDFCGNFNSANVDSMLLCATGQNFVYTNLLPDTLRVKPGDIFTSSQREDCSANKLRLAIAAADDRWEKVKADYMDSIAAAYSQTAYAALDSLESIHLNYTLGEYHYTLYYYDLAGNLVKTIPPDGVKPFNLAQVDSVQDLRAISDSLFKRPIHTHVTNYQYNTQNQIKVQNTPDGGSTKFWYDNAARLVASQNARQLGSDQFSYTIYDGQGRVVEVGQINTSATMNDTISADTTQFLSWLEGGTREQVTFTLYDEPLSDLTGTTSIERAVSDAFGPDGQTYIRNRVSSTFYIKDISAGDIYIYNNTVTDADLPDYLEYQSASHYSYDPHGNVKTLIQEVDSATLSTYGRRFFRMDYDYDLVSGNVNQVSYQTGQPDQFYHRYQYDADNRIVAVETSKDGWSWDQDARYFYYPHGPLSRAEIGDMNIQGMDYAYTLQGWLKSVNGTSLGRKRVSGLHDLGSDGEENGNLNETYAPDALAFGLEYYTGDYNSIGTNTSVADISGGSNAAVLDAENLFNGNISRMITALNDQVQNTTNTVLNNYHYDQLNRITGFKSFKEVKLTEDNISTGAGTYGYEGIYAYDPDGNITGLSRKDSTGSVTDNFNYYYDSTGAANNRLNYVSGYSNGVGNQSSNNYSYDAIGNLVSDAYEDIVEINWNVRGKINYIAKTNNDTIKFRYDPSGNRIQKIFKEHGEGTETTYYIRDAQGNTMATYKYTGSTLSLEERHIYGSDRLGLISEPVAITDNYGTIASGEGLNLALVESSKMVFDPGSLWTSLTLNTTGTMVMTIHAIEEALTISTANLTLLDGLYGINGSNIEVPIGGHVTFSTSADIFFAPTKKFALTLLSGTVYLEGFYGVYRTYDMSESERAIGYKRYELKNHLGNVLSTVSDRKVWKQIDGITSTLMQEIFTPAANEVGTLLDTEDWRVYNSGVVESVEGGTMVASDGENSGGFRTLRLDPYCYSKYCITLSNVPDETYISIFSSTSGMYITQNELLEYNEDAVTLCWDISQYGSDDLEIHLILSEGNSLVITKEELFRTVLPAGWSTLSSSPCLGMSEGGLVIPFHEEESTGIQTTIPLDAGCDHRLCFTVSDISGEGLLTVKDHAANVISTQYFSDPGLLCFNFTEGSYTSLTFIIELVDGISFTLADVKLEEICSINTQVADVMSAQDYYPFGSIMPGRKFHPAEGMHRYGFNGMERDEEIDQSGNSYSALFWQYDSRLGRRWNRDPKPNPSISEYATFANSPIWFSDVLGDSVKTKSLYAVDDKGNFKNENEIKSFELFASTDAGREYILNHAEEGFELEGAFVKDLHIKASKSGESHNKGVDVEFSVEKSRYSNEAETYYDINGGRLKLRFNYVDYGSGNSPSSPYNLLDYTRNISHEVFYHGSIYESRFAMYKSGKIGRDAIYSRESYHHQIPIGNTDFGKVGFTILKQSQQVMYNNTNYCQPGASFYKSSTKAMWPEFMKMITEQLANPKSDQQLREMLEYGME